MECKGRTLRIDQKEKGKTKDGRKGEKERQCVNEWNERRIFGWKGSSKISLLMKKMMFELVERRFEWKGFDEKEKGRSVF